MVTGGIGPDDPGWGTIESVHEAGGAIDSRLQKMKSVTAG
jgi:hypothetical protein